MTNIIRGNGPQRIEDEIAALARTSTGTGTSPSAFAPTTEKEHPALVACRKAADMVRGVHERHNAEGETLAQHIEKIGETFHEMCKEAANQIRAQRVLPQEMADKMADELVEMGQMEAERQGRVSRGLTAARDALLGIDSK